MWMFPISGHSLVTENYHNSRTSDDINMKLGPLTKLDKRNKKQRQQEIDDDVMPASYDVHVVFLINSHFRAVQ